MKFDAPSAGAGSCQTQIRFVYSPHARVTGLGFWLQARVGPFAHSRLFWTKIEVETAEAQSAPPRSQSHIVGRKKNVGWPREGRRRGRRLRATAEEMSLLKKMKKEEEGKREKSEGRSGPAVRVRDIKGTRRNEIQPRARAPLLSLSLFPFPLSVCVSVPLSLSPWPPRVVLPGSLSLSLFLSRSVPLPLSTLFLYRYAVRLCSGATAAASSPSSSRHLFILLRVRATSTSSASGENSLYCALFTPGSCFM